MIEDLNKKYWKQVPAKKTTSMDIIPSEETLRYIPNEGRVLDIGCGEGQLAEWFSKKGFKVNGIDINPNAIKACYDKETNVNYSLQDITEKTTFNNSFFDLVCSKFTLANIHRGDWELFRAEIERIVKPEGYVWLAEPLVSEDYSKRYNLAKNLFSDEHAIFVFKDPNLAKSIVTSEDLQDAISREDISRISRHYTRNELIDLFPSFDIVSEKINETKSPSGYKLNVFIGLLKKKND